MGLLSPRIVALAAGSGSRSAALAIGWRGSRTLALPDGREFRLSPRGFWRSEWTLNGPDRLPLLTMKTRFERGSEEASLELGPGSPSS